MFVVKRNQIIIAALVIMIAVAGYLNYADNNKTELVLNDDEMSLEALVPNEESVALALADEYDEIGIAIDDEGDLINITNDATSQKNDNEKQDSDSKDMKESTENKNESDKKEDSKDDTATKAENDDGAAVFVNASNDSTYFVQAKLEREQARSREKEILTELINNKNLDKEQRSKSADAMLEIQKRIERETSAEAMIESKGFSEVYVRIDEETVDVVVNKETLSEAETAQIEDIVKRKTGVTVDAIRISPLKAVGE